MALIEARPMNHRTRYTFGELLSELKARGVERPTSSRIRFAILNRRVPRPHLNASLRFEFTGDDIDRIEAHLRQIGTRGHRPASEAPLMGKC
jgi:hypothetical protein